MTSHNAVLGTRGRIFSGLATVALLGAGIVQAAPSALSADDEPCPAPYLVGEITDDQLVHGLTVTRHTTPTEFTGQVLGVVENGIAPGIDMIMAELTSDQIDETGIWQGMSGSPVYAEDGRLIGAVSYGMAFGPSPVAGITPAESMQKLLGAAPASPAARATLDRVQDSKRVTLTAKQTAEVAREAGLSARKVSDGFKQLPMPMFVSGNKARLNKAAKQLGMKGVRAFAGTTAAASDTPSVIVPGGNLAATVSYGDLTSGGIGTVTEVCDSEVLAFGHPMNWTGPSQMTLHGADTVFIQTDPVSSGFKVANLTAPAGSILEDRLAGLLGETGVLPETATVSAHVENVAGDSEHDGVTHVSVPEALPEIAAFHLLTDEDVVNDRIGAGSARVRWTVEGLRADGTPFDYTRVDKFASEYDLTFETIFDSYEDLTRILNNKFEDVTITDVSYRSLIDPEFKALKLTRVERKVNGQWIKLANRREVDVRGGSTMHLRVVLDPVEGGPTVVQPLDLHVPDVSRRTFGFLDIGGGDRFRGSRGATSFEGLLNGLASAPHNNSVIAELFVQRRGPDFHTTKTHATAEVVRGGMSVGLQVR